MLARIATGLLRMFASVTVPCSVKTCGAYFTFWPRFKVTICDLEGRMSAASSIVSLNMKSSGKRSLFLLTAWLSALV